MSRYIRGNHENSAKENAHVNNKKEHPDENSDLCHVCICMHVCVGSFSIML